MKKNRWIKITADIVILVCSIILWGLIYFGFHAFRQFIFNFYLLAFVLVLSLADFVYQIYSPQIQENARGEKGASGLRAHEINRLILLNEQDKPIKSWDMAGRVSLVIGRAGKEEDVDVDLENCAFSGFIDFQHAALNFCIEQWYVEDLGSKNGVRIQKADDGECYKVMGRPCRVEAGDILYIANTRLLLS